MDTIPCPSCAQPMPAARAHIAIANGVCAPCNAPNLACSREDTRPMYETEAWSRGIRL